MEKVEFYRRVKIAGLAAFIPFVLLSGPIGGYLIGDFLKVHFHLNSFIVFIFLSIGTIASFLETVRIIRRMIQVDKRP